MAKKKKETSQDTEEETQETSSGADKNRQTDRKPPTGKTQKEQSEASKKVPGDAKPKKKGPFIWNTVESPKKGKSEHAHVFKEARPLQAESEGFVDVETTSQDGSVPGQSNSESIEQSVSGPASCLFEKPSQNQMVEMHKEIEQANKIGKWTCDETKKQWILTKANAGGNAVFLLKNKTRNCPCKANLVYAEGQDTKPMLQRVIHRKEGNPDDRTGRTIKFLMSSHLPAVGVEVETGERLAFCKKHDSTAVNVLVMPGEIPKELMQFLGNDTYFAD